jgi:hypothetical protein
VENIVDGAFSDIGCASVAPPPTARLDESKIETLRVWGEGLAADPRDEVRAAGRAITLLVEEIERLNVDLWNARAQVAADLFTPDREELLQPLQRRLVPRYGD